MGEGDVAESDVGSPAEYMPAHCVQNQTQNDIITFHGHSGDRPMADDCTVLVGLQLLYWVLCDDSVP